LAEPEVSLGDRQTAPPPAWRGRLGRLSPAHGWQSFWTEIVVVVLGILIALGAQQTVDWWNARRDTAEFRAALNDELGYNLARYRERVKQAECTTRRLDELEAWWREWRDGNGPGIEGSLGRPLAYPPSRVVWLSGAENITKNMPLEERNGYAALHDGAVDYVELALIELAVWRDLQAYDSATQLSPEEVNRLRGLILSARSIDRSMRGNASGAIEGAAQMLRVKPSAQPVYPLSMTGLCEPLKLVRRGSQ